MSDSGVIELQDPSERPSTIRWFGVVFLIGHVALLLLGGLALWQIAGGWWLGAVAAASLAVLYIAVWRFWLAPGSRYRLGYRERLTMHLVLGPGVVVLTALTQLWLAALVALSVILLGDALDERSRR